MTILFRLSQTTCNGIIRQPLPLGLSGISLACRRTATFMSKIRQTASEKERSFLVKDKIPAGFQLVYRAPMENYLKTVNIVSAASAIGVALFTINTVVFNADVVLPIDINHSGLVSDEIDIWFFAAGFVAINVAIRVFIAKYPLRIYKNAEKYLVIYERQLLRNPQHSFKQGDVVKVGNVLNPWRDLMFRLGKRSSLLLIDYFKTPSEFHKMCGST